MPNLGAIMGFNFIADNGYEGYQYNWGTHPNLDGSKPLELLNHMDGNPILGLVCRRTVSPQHYEMVEKWGKTAWNYMEEIGLPRLPEDKRAKAQAFLADLKPLLERLNIAVRDKWLPAVADGQIGLVVDAKLTSEQLQRSMPMMQNEMPIIEPALIVGVSNADLLKEAIHEFHGVYNDLIDLICKQPDVPEHAKRICRNSNGPSPKSKPWPAALHTNTRCRSDGAWIKTSFPTRRFRTSCG